MFEVVAFFALVGLGVLFGTITELEKGELEKPEFDREYLFVGSLGPQPQGLEPVEHEQLSFEKQRSEKGFPSSSPPV
jgi:hypothetical protein